MTTTTMNGWSLTSVPLATIAAGGHSTRVRAGAVATVLGHVARRFHAEVEPLVTFYGWRSVATCAAVGGHPRSNHPSGTAIDFNGYAHPYKAPINFTAAQVAAIRRILDEIAHWHDAARGRTAAWFLAAFRANPAETGTVRAAYRTILHRAPESAAVVTQWQKGHTIAQVWAGVGESAEAKARR